MRARAHACLWNVSQTKSTKCLTLERIRPTRKCRMVFPLSRHIPSIRINLYQTLSPTTYEYVRDFIQ